MFTDSSDIYDLIYSFKDYEMESADIIQTIKKLRPECKTILDIGCGTSEHHKYLNKHYSIDGIDLNEKFIQISKQKNPSGYYSVENMLKFELNKKYDVIICLFSSIGYLQSLEEIVSALKCFNKHLNPNGILILEPWFTKENWNKGKVHMLSYEKEDIKICRMNRSYLSGDVTILNFHYLVGTIEKGVQYFQEEHKLRLTSTDEMQEALRIADFEYSFDEKGLNGRGMYYGVKMANV
jgi:2-polyprenyl-3-methyl-5-hydroxy-6-metoxy-1,4-benzoquinol methylase